MAWAAATAMRPADAAEGEEQIAPGRHVERVHHLDPHEQDREGVLHRGDVRHDVTAHLVEEPQQHHHRGHRHQPLDPHGRPGPGAVGEDHAGDDQRHGGVGGRPRDLAAGRRRPAMATTTAPAHATRRRMEFSGRAGLVGPADRPRPSSSADTATSARASARRPGPPGPGAARRSASVGHRPRSPRPDRLGGGEQHRDAPVEELRGPCPRARSATRSASSRSGGSVTDTVTGSADGPSSSRTISSPAWAVAGQCMWRRLSPERYCRVPLVSSGSTGTRWPLVAGVVVVARRGSGTGRPRRGATWSGEASGSRDPAGPPLQPERGRRGDVDD